MIITLTWGLIVMIIITLLLFAWIIQQFSEHGDWGVLSSSFIFLFMILLWAIYGGVAWW